MQLWLVSSVFWVVFVHLQTKNYIVYFRTVTITVNVHEPPTQDMSTGLCVLKRLPRQSFSDPRRSGLNGGHGKTVLAHSIILSLVL